MKSRIISLVIFIFSLIYLAGSLSLKPGTIERPGAGFVPAGIAIALLLVSAFNAYKAFRSSDEQQNNGSWKRFEPIAFAIGLVIFPILLNYLSFVISIFLVLTFCLRILKYKTLFTNTAIALFTSLLSFWLFAKVLGVTLPSGPIEDIILRL